MDCDTITVEKNSTDCTKKNLHKALELSAYLPTFATRLKITGIN